MSNLELLDRAAGATTCALLNIGGANLAGAGFVGIVAGGPVMLPLAAGAAMLLAANYGCAPMDLGGPSPIDGIDGCQQMEPDGYGQLEWKPPGSNTWAALQAGDYGPWATEITNVDISEESPDRGWASLVFFNAVGISDYGWTTAWFSTREEAAQVKYRIVPRVGECAQQGDDIAPMPPEMFEPQPYTDSVTNCNFNITFQGMAQPVPDGPVKPVYLLQQAGEARADGGVMGGCNWPDTIFMPSGGGGGGGEGPVYLPVPPGPLPPNGPGGVPWWAAPLLAGSTSAALNLIGQELAKMSEPDFEPGSFTMVAPCDINEDGSPQARTWEFPKASFQQRMNAHQVAMMDMLQQHLVWKTPTCGDNDKPEIEGDWRSISFRSDKTSPYGKSRLRKRFRYRSTSGWSYDALINHWKDFVWESGPVVVQHSGSSWGTPQVWAATADEGKRVIRHAAGEAGIDPDQVGRWTISGSRGARYGVSDTMRVETKGGYYWITARDGSDARPLVAKVPHP